MDPEEKAFDALLNAKNAGSVAVRMWGSGAGRPDAFVLALSGLMKQYGISKIIAAVRPEDTDEG